ncbi:threonine synthase [Lachnospiraceae bacterium PF1-21]|uniref:threonine synthase n=1 Tax=Ohessyouella blattaphilus TaxID=2949333 RepID=UPI003E1EC7AA
MQYTSTRDKNVSVTPSEAILTGLAPDGGLFVPETIPSLGKSLDELKDLSYQEVAYEVLKLYLTDYTEAELKDCINKAYDEKFDTELIAPLVKADSTYFLELFHGATIAFKDMALSILPHLLVAAAKKNQADKEIVILAATSGDTGKAAMAGFADVAGTRIIVFYPKDGVSKVQEMQMLTQKGDNVDVVAITGNFDHAQSGVKEMFENQELAAEMAAAGYQFSSANSINIGRLVPQIAYYVYAYAKLLKEEEITLGEPLDVVVPTGNFGNILAAYLAKEMGVPIGKLICASNENKVLYDFFTSGTYDRNRDFILTSSPSMDILISSNLERLLYFVSGNSAQATKQFMEDLKQQGSYSVTPEMQAKMADFIGGYATEAQTAEEIKAVYENTGYVMDTHTAVAAYVGDEYRRRHPEANKQLVISTASPFKFVKSVMSAIDNKFADVDEFALLEKLVQVSQTEMPQAIKEIIDAKTLHDIVCAPEKMEATVKEILSV